MIKKHLEPPAGVTSRATVRLSGVGLGQTQGVKALRGVKPGSCAPVDPAEEKEGLGAACRKPTGGNTLQAEREAVRWRGPQRGSPDMQRVHWLGG